MIRKATKVENNEGVEFEVSYEGCVLGEYERNGYDDSDFFAIVWDEEAQCVTTVMYATTRGWTYANSCHVDATDEVKAKATKWVREHMTRHYLGRLQSAAQMPGKDMECLVLRGRKVAPGTVVTVLGQPMQRQGFRQMETVSLCRLPDGSTQTILTEYLVPLAVTLPERSRAEEQAEQYDWTYAHSIVNGATVFAAIGDRTALSRRFTTCKGLPKTWVA